MRCPVDLATKANPCLRIEEHKQERERMQPNPNGVAAAVYEDSRVVQDPLDVPLMGSHMI